MSEVPLVEGLGVPQAQGQGSLSERVSWGWSCPVRTGFQDQVHYVKSSTFSVSLGAALAVGTKLTGHVTN